MTSYYEIAGHSLAVHFVDEANDDRLIPSFAPFHVEDEPEELLFTMTVDDNLEWLEEMLLQLGLLQQLQQEQLQLHQLEHLLMSFQPYK